MGASPSAMMATSKNSLATHHTKSSLECVPRIGDRTQAGKKRAIEDFPLKLPKKAELALI
ncbi:MAG: hypothetical protein EAZ78_01120 [Oscillatoriales cyanobacterium]|nr:MAG: hypothetical protein EAZ98_13345 [Oscillatoriales cyanobacterium]TAE04117.1 MAG: hypothetical protein EAZ96_10555 [Oscillatoriales cyanobacterium]TAF06905.1 MAG: hypothetical protein EAZ78_01120 [Oscillatoriales cyanobacterium]TAF37745.1 MAG: hypothetical protein EAZ68_14105 [Oscillatoriales cyanobacterium]TAF71493.1 MAG: hypothetical protein EAZ59_00820 [Oscillatoriales cyanobacterium]